MSRVRFSSLALADLEEIAAYIERDSGDAARLVANQLEEVCFSLGEFPEMGVASEVRGTRKLIAPGLPYKIIYQFFRKIDTVVILRVYHDARDTRY